MFLPNTLGRPRKDVHTSLHPFGIVLNHSALILANHHKTPQSKYLDNHWTSTKFCSLQFKGAHVEGSKAEMKGLRDVIVHAKGYDDLNDLITIWNGEEEFAEIVSAIQCRQGRKPFFAALPIPESEIKDERENEKRNAGGASGGDGAEEQVQEILQDPTVPPEVLRTPPIHSGPPDSALLNAPLLANEMRMPIPAFVSGRDAPTPTPTPHP
ncbi:hypothetical protein NLI96_g1908 [Meripilus lineatus]|uniref:Uncharacterized protein n=1 Tax=Meripilus lineatus TaxID=2056292 RepID=A0AAD5VBT6_9APHY|nr:hypothetical protein NLI96_g1908 [Physisporinus lineatus]